MRIVSNDEMKVFGQDRVMLDDCSSNRSMYGLITHPE